MSTDGHGGASNANRGADTVVLDSAVTGCSAVSVQAASDNADGLPDVATNRHRTGTRRASW